MDFTNDRLEFCRTIAVLGGTFDPIHCGHLAVAEAVCQAYEPDRVLFVPAARPPHKSDGATPFEDRYQMAQWATADHPRFAVSRMEQDRPGFSYTIDTIRALRNISDAEIIFITGADTALDILSWKDAEELLTLCRFAVVPRPGTDKNAVKAHLDKLCTQYKAWFDILEASPPDISGTQIRKYIAQGKSMRYLLPYPVEDYIRRNGLYGCKPTSFEACRQALSLVLSPRRFSHTLGVVKSAEQMAAHYNADIEKARFAALLHDCAKEYAPDKKRTLCALWGIETDDIIQVQIDLAHGLLGAESARRDYGIYDAEILQAIRYHTAGHKDMTLLDKIILLADFIEPTRDDYPGLEEMRKLAFTDIDAALLVGLRGVLEDNTQRGRAIHPWSTDAIETLERPI